MREGWESKPTAAALIDSRPQMIRIFVTAFAALAGLAFGSFLNVCLSRWPEGESVVQPRSHCRNCGRTLTWWENIPLLSWLALRGHCRTCKSPISWRYPAVEFAVAALWSGAAYTTMPTAFNGDIPSALLLYLLGTGVLKMAFAWILVALAMLDAENLWLPNFLTIPGIVIGFLRAVLWPFALLKLDSATGAPLTEGMSSSSFSLPSVALTQCAGILAAALLILAIRWLYWLLRRREGIGLGDAKLMALLAAWLGLPGALLSFAIGVILGSVVGIVVLMRGPRAGAENPALARLPLGTFLCIGGIVASLWGQPILAAYMHYASLN